MPAELVAPVEQSGQFSLFGLQRFGWRGLLLLGKVQNHARVDGIALGLDAVAASEGAHARGVEQGDRDVAFEEQLHKRTLIAAGGFAHDRDWHADQAEDVRS